MTTLIAIIGAVATLVSAFSVGTLIKFFVERKDGKDIMRKQVEQNTEAIKQNAVAIDELKAETQIIKAMCLGSLYDRTKYLAESYIKRGYITMQEYHDWLKYLYEPYHNGGGDGTVDYLKDKIDELPIKEI